MRSAIHDSGTASRNTTSMRTRPVSAGSVNTAMAIKAVASQTASSRRPNAPLRLTAVRSAPSQSSSGAAE